MLFFFIDHRTCRAIWILIWIFFRVFDFTVYIITQPGIRFETFVDYLALFQIICWLKVILMLWGYIFNLSELGACIVYCIQVKSLLFRFVKGIFLVYFGYQSDWFIYWNRVIKSVVVFLFCPGFNSVYVVYHCTCSFVTWFSLLYCLGGFDGLIFQFF